MTQGLPLRLVARLWRIISALLDDGITFIHAALQDRTCSIDEGLLLNIALNAHRWGIKAAQAGLPASSNPFNNPQARAAWRAGYQRAMLRPLVSGRVAVT